MGSEYGMHKFTEEQINIKNTNFCNVKQFIVPKNVHVRNYCVDKNDNDVIIRRNIIYQDQRVGLQKNTIQKQCLNSLQLVPTVQLVLNAKTTVVVNVWMTPCVTNRLDNVTWDVTRGIKILFATKVRTLK